MFGEGLHQGIGKENSADSRTPDSRGTMQFFSESWCTGTLSILNKEVEGSREFLELSQKRGVLVIWKSYLTVSLCRSLSSGDHFTQVLRISNQAGI